MTRNWRFGFRLFLLGGAILLLSSAARSQTMSLAITLQAVKSATPEHLPIQIRIVVENVSNREIQVEPYDTSRLPQVVPNIRFESQFRRTAEAPRIIDFGAPTTRIAPGRQLVLDAYLQDYLTGLPVGRYVIPYSLDWKYSFPLEAAKQGSTEHKSGEFTITVVPATSTAIQSYIDGQVEAIQNLPAYGPAQTAAREITMVDDPAALAAGPALLKAGLQGEALTLARRFDTPASNRLLEQLVQPHTNPVIVEDCLDTLAQRRVPVSVIPVDVVREFLASSKIVLQTLGLKMVGSENARLLVEPIEALKQSPDDRVRRAAVEALKKVQ